ncbi:hypothetical protein Leryth_001233 [Lithospermum erythrorhizon]|uniref:Methyltransferase n=1 Tax=Lithospermum erythrorhizon TaxID=34254 RepID=A0AAV3Q0W0_LITER|nr:hypothetical protein Leryth_001233 [Lithospermum erythrorhizon]
MCPMRFILVFFSAILAGYLAWRTISSTEELKIQEDLIVEGITSQKENYESNLKKKVQNGFWVFVDMASGRYLWTNVGKING